MFGRESHDFNAQYTEAVAAFTEAIGVQPVNADELQAAYNGICKVVVDGNNAHQLPENVEPFAHLSEYAGQAASAAERSGLQEVSESFKAQQETFGVAAKMRGSTPEQQTAPTQTADKNMSQRKS